MPSHILQLGMWPEAAASNEASWAASDTWVQQKHLPISKRDYHSLHWLLIYLQQGRYGKAEALLTQMRQSLAEFPKDDPRNLMFGTFTLANMAGTFVVETAQWDAAEQWLGSPSERLRIPSLGPRPAAVLSRCKLPCRHSGSGNLRSWTCDSRARLTRRTRAWLNCKPCARSRPACKCHSSRRSSR